MNSFGLGLVLNFTDNASAGMNRVSQTFSKMNGIADTVVDASDSAAFAIDSLTSAGMGLTIVGEQLSSFGNSIISVFAGASQAVIDTGLEMFSYRNQLRALYGENAFEDKMASIQEYAKNSVFEVQGLTNAVVTMKAVGIEAMNAVTSSSGATTQTLMDYASDIAAMFPNMRNAYGTGVNAAMGALKEYIAEGNALSLKRGAGLDITGILGEDKGASIEERTRQVADLVEQLGIAGYTTSLLGTPTQQLSKMQDILFNTMSKIADGGVLDKYTTLLTTLADWLDNLYENTERYEAITSLVSDTLNSVLTPLQSLLEYAIKIADKVIDWALEHQTLAKYVLITVAAIGALLVVGGQVLKLSGGFFMLTSSLMNMSKLASNGISIFNVFGRAFGVLATKILPIVGLAAVLYTAWSQNLFGIRDTITGVIRNIVDTISLVVDAFSDNTLSGENFQKAKDMGILPLIETILDLKYRFDFFKQGFIQGWNEVVETIIGTASKITSALGDSVFGPIIERVSGFFSKLSETDTDSWFSVGEVVAKFTGMLVAILPVVSIVTKLGSRLKGLIPIVKGIFSLVAAHPVVAIIIGVIGALAVLYNKCEGFRNFVNGLFTSIKEVFEGTLGEVFYSLRVLLNNLISNLAPLKDAFMSFLPQVSGFLQKIFGFLAKVVSQVVELVMKLLPSVIQVLTTIMNVVMQLLPPIFTVLDTVFSIISDLIFPIITELFDMLIPFITQITDLVTELVDGVLVIIVGLLEDIIPVISSLIQLVIPMIKRIFDALKPVITTLMNIITAITARLIPVIKNLVGIVSDIIKMVVNIAAPIITLIMQIVEVIISVLLPIIDVILVAVGFIIDIIMGIVQAVVSVVAFIVKIVTGIVNVIVGIVSAIVQFIMSGVSVIVGIVQVIIDTITGIIKGIISVVQTVWSFIVNTFSNAFDFFAGVFGAIFDYITGVFQGIANFFTNVWNGIVGAFATLGDTISGAIKGAINGVLSAAIGIVNGFIKAINFAIDVINAIPGVSITKLNLLTVPQLAEGGVVDKPTIAQIGEAGKEAVVPLENNTEWTDKVANKLAPKLNAQPQLQGNNNAPTKEEHNDYSVTFAAGSIVIQLVNATDAELEKAAEKLMKIIERKQQLKAMAVRA